MKITFSGVLFGKKGGLNGYPLENLGFFFILFGFLGIFSSCQTAPSYQSIKALPEAGWHQDSVVQLDFSILEPGQRFDLLYQIQYQDVYPFDNVYLKYWLTGPSGDTLISSRDNLFLFQPRVGKPIGIGLANHRMLDAYFLRNILLQDSGQYQVHVRHYMRKEKLEGIRQIGVKLRPARS